MTAILMRFWPVLLPLVLYLIWHEWRNYHAKKAGQERYALRDGPWLWAVAATLGLAVAVVLWFGLSSEPRTHTAYQPAEIKDGKLIPGQFAPQSND
jgi:hypothetical protein